MAFGDAPSKESWRDWILPTSKQDPEWTALMLMLNFTDACDAGRSADSTIAHATCFRDGRGSVVDVSCCAVCTGTPKRKSSFPSFTFNCKNWRVGGNRTSLPVCREHSQAIISWHVLRPPRLEPSWSLYPNHPESPASTVCCTSLTFHPTKPFLHTK